VYAALSYDVNPPILMDIDSYADMQTSADVSKRVTRLCPCTSSRMLTSADSTADVTADDTYVSRRQHDTTADVTADVSKRVTRRCPCTSSRMLTSADATADASYADVSRRHSRRQHTSNPPMSMYIVSISTTNNYWENSGVGVVVKLLVYEDLSY
jgi:hypothetical protein